MAEMLDDGCNEETLHERGARSSGFFRENPIHSELITLLDYLIIPSQSMAPVTRSTEQSVVKGDQAKVTLYW